MLITSGFLRVKIFNNVHEKVMCFLLAENECILM